MQKQTLRAKNFFNKLNELNKSFAECAYNTNTEISDQTREKYQNQEIDEINKLFRDNTDHIECVTKFNNGLGKYELVNSYGEKIGELHDVIPKSELEADGFELKGYEGIFVDFSTAALYNAQAAANAKYKREKVKRLELNFYPTDKAIWNKLEAQASKAGYIKKLILDDIQKS